MAGDGVGVVPLSFVFRGLNLRVGFDSFLQADLEAAVALYSVRSFDLFPQTAHVETVLRMSRG